MFKFLRKKKKNELLPGRIDVLDLSCGWVRTIVGAEFLLGYVSQLNRLTSWLIQNTIEKTGGLL